MPELPTIESSVAINDEHRLTFTVAPTSVYFQGHFTDLPVLAGVVQVTWAIHLAHRYLDTPLNIRSLSKLKFSKPVFGGDPLELLLALPDERLRFSLLRNGDRCTSGEVCFA